MGICTLYIRCSCTPVDDIYAQNGTLDSIIRQYQQKYQDAGESLTREEAMDEIVSDFTQEFLNDTQMVKDFLAESEENRSWFKKIIDWTKGLAAKLKKNGTKETNALLEGVENALKLWEKAYAEGIEAVKNAPVRESTGEDVSRKSVDVDSTQKLYQGVNLSEDSSVYTYEFLTSLPDMQIVALPDVDSIRTNGKVDTTKVVSAGMKNARTVGAERDGKVLVNNLYTGGLLRINTNTIRHGLNGSTNRLLTNSRLGAIIGDVVHNAVPINALHNKAENVTGTYAMVQYARDSKGREFIAVVTVEQKSHNISDIEVYDVVHALSGRQKKSSQASTKLQSINSIKAATISIADVLRAVKDTHQSILSESVLDHFNEQRNQNGDYAGKAKFSISGTENILQEAEERAAAERDALDRLRYLRKQVAVTKLRTADPKSVDKIARQLIQKWGAELDAEDISQNLQELYDHALRGDEVEIWDEAVAIGRRIAEGFTEVEGDIYKEYADLRRELRNMHIYVSPEVASNIADYFDVVRPYRNRLKLTTRDSGAMGVDQAFQVLQDSHPEFFNEDKISNPADQLLKILEVTDSIYERGTSRFLEAQEVENAASWIANDILDSYTKLDTFKTVADIRQDIKAARAAGMESQKKIDAKKIQNVKQQLDAVRKAKEQRIQDLKDKQSLAIKNRIKSRDKAELRHKIFNVVNHLNDLLINETKDRHVLDALKAPVAMALDAVNMDTVSAAEWLVKLEEQRANAKTDLQRQQIEKKMNRVRAMGGSMAERLANLKDAYQKIIQENDGFDEVILDQIDEVKNLVGDIPLRDMNTAELKLVHDLYKMILTSVRNSNKAFSEARKESIEVMGKKAMAEVLEVGGKKLYKVSGTGGVEQFFWDNLKPVYIPYKFFSAKCEIGIELRFDLI